MTFTRSVVSIDYFEVIFDQSGYKLFVIGSTIYLANDLLFAHIERVMMEECVKAFKTKVGKRTTNLPSTTF